MYTQKVMDKNRYDYQRLYFKISYDKVVFLTYPVKCIRGFKRCRRCKQYLCMPIYSAHYIFLITILKTPVKGYPFIILFLPIFFRYPHLLSGTVLYRHERNTVICYKRHPKKIHTRGGVPLLEVSLNLLIIVIISVSCCQVALVNGVILDFR